MLRNLKNNQTSNQTRNETLSGEDTPSLKAEALRVYYDGLCPLCSREIDHYRGQAGSEQILFVDITHPQFNPEKEGLDPFKIHKVMHVKDSDGRVFTKVDAFVEIWKRLDRYHNAAKLAQLFGVRHVLGLGYNVFAVIRPYLPRKADDCERSPFCEVRGQQFRGQKS